MKQKMIRHSIRLKLLVLYLALLWLTSAVLFSVFSYRFEKVYNEQSHSHMADVNAISAINVSNMVKQIDQLSVSVLIDQVVQENLSIINEKSASYNETNGVGSVSSYESAISSQIRGSVFNIDGIISLRIYPLSGDEIFIGTTNREYLEYSMTAEEIYSENGGAVWGMAGEDHYLCLGRAILSTENMQPLGYMVIICKNDYLGDVLATERGEYSSTVYLLDEKGQIVSSGVEEIIGGEFPYTPKELRSGEITMLDDPVSGEKSFYYVGEETENGWTLVTTVTTEQFGNTVFLVLLQMVAALLIALALSFLITRIAVKKLLAPTEDLLKSMSFFGGGNLEARVSVKSMDEIGQIGEAYNQMADNIQNLMEKVYRLELANKEAEVEYLKMQINPHFLYNSLDMISWLGFTGGNEKVSDISVSLAKLLRASINRADMITVEEEMQTVESYLLIQKCRFEDRIAVECSVEEECKNCCMPGFLLQPLIENSIVHGLENQSENGKLTIRIFKNEGWLCFEVKDDGKGIDKERLEEIRRQCGDYKSAQSVGIVNVYRRLNLMFGKDFVFLIESQPGAGTEISIQIPASESTATQVNTMPEAEEYAAE